MEFLDLCQKRRSVRKYNGDSIPEEVLDKIIRAGLLAPSSKGIYPIKLIVVRDREMLLKLSECKAGGSGMVKASDAAIVVIGDGSISDAWIEDASITMTLMMMEATEQGVGSCWVQCRNRFAADGESSGDYIKRIMIIPEKYCVLAVLSLGIAAEFPESRRLPDTDSEKVEFR